MKKKMIMAAVVVAMAAGTALAAESLTESVTFSGGTKVESKERVVTNGQLRRIERMEEVTAGPGKGLKRLICAEEAGRNGKIIILEKAANGRMAKAEGLYQRY